MRSTLLRAAATAAALSAAALLCIVAAPANAAPAPTINAANYVKYAVPSDEAYVPEELVAGADGAMWYTDYDTKIGVTSATGKITEFSMTGGHTTAYSLTQGSDGNIWFTTYDDKTKVGYIGRITPADVQTYFEVPSGSDISNLALGPDGNIWFSADDSGDVDTITPSGTITDHKMSAITSPVQIVRRITAGSDGTMLIASNSYASDTATNLTATGHFGSMTTAGAYTDHALPIGHLAQDLTIGSDGNIWGTTVTRASATSEYPVAIGVDEITSGGVIAPYSVGSDSNGQYIAPRSRLTAPTCTSPPPTRWLR
ncbi:hypothetical protein AX769_18105 [Frondihabitans sp. PAMC 28766]|uniref:Vgb family protein n=1 Tax=Frondihabitans sp. PAMC 28766 TaxID=1795630 RepID=UPI00078CF751|nr:hypothetical protein [Frondihabitans sp. PAMC 28766]AMM21712.1 hypothetical protein AX769_18105 [Frondihabitans sp. PAMC 28766]